MPRRSIGGSCGYGARARSSCADDYAHNVRGAPPIIKKKLELPKKKSTMEFIKKKINDSLKRL